MSPRSRLTFRIALATAMLADAPAFAGSYEAVTAPCFFDIQPPTIGTVTAPENASLSGATVSFLAVTDCSGVAKVELWSRKDTVPSWTDTTFFATDGIGADFNFVPGSGAGSYHFDLVMEDNLGNRTVTPLDSASVGAASTLFGAPASVVDWMIF